MKYIAALLLFFAFSHVHAQQPPLNYHAQNRYLISDQMLVGAVYTAKASMIVAALGSLVLADDAPQLGQKCVAGSAFFGVTAMILFFYYVIRKSYNHRPTRLMDRKVADPGVGGLMCP